MSESDVCIYCMLWDAIFSIFLIIGRSVFFNKIDDKYLKIYC